MKRKQTKNVRLIIRNADTKKVLLDTVVKKGDANKPFDLLDEAANIQDQENWLSTIPCHIDNFGIKRISSNGVKCSSVQNLPDELIVHTSKNSFLIGNVSLRDPVKVSVTDPYNGKHEINLRLEMEAYSSGLALNTGTKVPSLTGKPIPKYLGVNENNKVCLADLSKAYIFQSWTEMFELLNKYRDKFIDLCSKIDGDFSVDIIGDGVKDYDTDRINTLSLLDEINDAYNTYIPEELSPVVFINDIHYEGLCRLQLLKCPKHVLRAFDRHEDISMRNPDGQYTEPDEDAEKGLSKCKEIGFIPYLIAKVSDGIYDIYTVSRDSEEWSKERPGKGAAANVFTYECHRGIWEMNDMHSVI